MTFINKPKVLLVGGPDINTRIPIMRHLEEFQMAAVGSTKNLKYEFAQSGYEYFSYPLHRGINPISDFITLLHLVQLFRRQSPKVVHTFDTKPGVLGRLAARFAGVPVVVGTLPGLGILYSNKNWWVNVLLKIYQPVQKLACFNSDLTIFQNQEDLEQLVQERVVHRSRTAIITGSGVQTQIYDSQKITLEQKQQIRADLNLDEKIVVIVMIARLIRSKGVLEYAQVANSIRAQNPDTVFLLIGSDDHDSVDVLTRDERKLITESVTSLGKRNDIVDLLAISDIFVFPTYYREGIPRVLLEAASMGLPIVATDIAGCREVVKHKENGILVPVRDTQTLRNAIEALINDPILRKRFGVASRLRAMTCFDLSIIAKQTTDIYKSLLAEKIYGKQPHSGSL